MHVSKPTKNDVPFSAFLIGMMLLATGAVCGWICYTLASGGSLNELRWVWVAFSGFGGFFMLRAGFLTISPPENERKTFNPYSTGY